MRHNGDYGHDLVGFVGLGGNCGLAVCWSNLVGELMRHGGYMGMIWWVLMLVDLGCVVSVVPQR